MGKYPDAPFVVASSAKRQVEEYALLLYYFHKASTNRRIVPVIVSSETIDADMDELNQRELFPQLPRYWVAPVQRSSWDALASVLIEVGKTSAGQIPAKFWDESPYFPVPSIIEAALALKSGLSIREIAHSEASEHEIGMVGQTVQGFVDRARTERHHAICFLTGVPGSGKTLVGLSLAHSDENKASAIHFMSGNGPLVQVLQHLFTQESMRSGASATHARLEAKTLIENVHVFARYHTQDNLGSPFNHAIIFDEAQRAWNRTQNMRKFKRDYSEPEMLLRIMERHQDWAVVVALVGGGQEINDGEAGLEEWGRALIGSAKDSGDLCAPRRIGRWCFYCRASIIRRSSKGICSDPPPNLQIAVWADWVNHVWMAKLKRQHRYEAPYQRAVSVAIYTRFTSKNR